MNPKSSPFRLPKSLTWLYIKSPGRVVAHNLDFDLVAVGKNMAEAKSRLALCTKAYVEFGLSQGLQEFIVRPAPEDLWDKVLDSKIAGSDPVILIDDKRQGQPDWKAIASSYALENVSVAG